MPDVVFKVSLEAAKAIQNAVQIANSFKGVEADVGKAAQSLKRYDGQVNALSVTARRAVQDQQRLKSTLDAIARTQAKTWGGVDLSISRTGRALARSGGSSQVAAEADYRSFSRFVQARNLKDDRAFQKFLAEEEGAAREMAKLREAIALNRSRVQGMDRAVAAELNERKAGVDHQVMLNNAELRAAKRQKQGKENSAFIVGAAGAIAAGIYGASSYAQNYEMELGRIGSTNTGFERQLRPLLGVNGFRNSERIRGRVLSLSGAYGLSAEEVTNAIYGLQNNAANFDPKTQNKLFASAANMTQTSGGDLATNVAALTKVWQIYGDQLGSIEKAQVKVQKAADESAASIQDIAQNLADVLPSAKAFGISFDEVAASLITATQVSGDTEKAMTNLRNIYLRLSDAEKQGIHLTGSLTDKLRELSRVDPVKLKDIFGDRAVSLIAALAEKSGDVAKNLERMQKVTSDDAFRKTVKMLTDAKIRDTNLRTSLATNLQNVDILRAQDAVTRNKDIDYKLRETGYEESVPTWIRSLPTVSTIAKPLLLAAGNQTWNGPGWTKLGLERVINQKFDADDEQSHLEANMLQLKYGDVTGMSYRNKKGKSVATGENDVTTYVQMLQAGHHLSAGQYTQFRTLEENDPTGKASAKYLASIDAMAKNLHTAAANINAAAANLAQASTGRVGRMRNNHN